MNTGMTVTYQGSLRNQATHVRSGNTLTTDAPLDNNGKGEAFSPTDLLCTSLATCMITLMGITAESKGIAVGNISAEIEKVMAVKLNKVLSPARAGDPAVLLAAIDKAKNELGWKPKASLTEIITSSWQGMKQVG